MAEFTEHGVLAERCLIGLDGSDDGEAVVTEALEHGTIPKQFGAERAGLRR